MSKDLAVHQRGLSSSVVARAELDADGLPTENGRHGTASDTAAMRDLPVMPVELISETGDRDINVREFHDALAVLLFRYHGRTQRLSEAMT